MIGPEDFAKEIKSILDTNANAMYPERDYGAPWQNLIKKPTKLERFLCWVFDHNDKVTWLDDTATKTEIHICKRCNDTRVYSHLGPFEVGPFITGKL